MEKQPDTNAKIAFSTNKLLLFRYGAYTKWRQIKFKLENDFKNHAKNK